MLDGRTSVERARMQVRRSNEYVVGDWGWLVEM